MVEQPLPCLGPPRHKLHFSCCKAYTVLQASCILVGAKSLKTRVQVKPNESRKKISIDLNGLGFGGMEVLINPSGGFIVLGIANRDTLVRIMSNRDTIIPHAGHYSPLHKAGFYSRSGFYWFAGG